MNYLQAILDYKSRVTCMELNSPAYMTLYSSFPDKQKETFSLLHGGLIECFRLLNDRMLPHGNGHFKAEDSRTLLQIITMIYDFHGAMSQSEKHAFEIDKYYQSVFDQCKSFLKTSNGSAIPDDMHRIDLYETKPIFHSLSSTAVILDSQPADLHLIGEGSYAKVFSFTYPKISKKFALKQAKQETLNDKELIRFQNEFNAMKSLNSPYILEVYSYDETRHSYIMEHADMTLYKYIQRNNQNLKLAERRALGLQILKGFEYIHTKNMLHRDISPNNVLIKKYEDTVVAKICDFGLVKLPESLMTSCNTELKGCYNDPALSATGFKNYNIWHETYALSTLLGYIMTGKQTPHMEHCPAWGAFVQQGRSYDCSKRFQTLQELKEAFLKLCRK